MSSDQGKPESIGGRGKKRGLMRIVLALRPEQAEQLRDEARRRMMAQKATRIDTGEVAREALDQAAQLRDAVGRAHMELYRVLGKIKRFTNEGKVDVALELAPIAEQLVKISDDLVGASSPRLAAGRNLQNGGP